MMTVFLAAARQVFLRYGYRRVTMGDIADAAKMSRPALYLVIPSKEEIFTAVLAQTFSEMLEEIRGGIGSFQTARDKLTFAF
ncbi:MAG TPA: helix-turn-helix domain-containing protein, partial [Hyphomicrobium sp.]